MKKYLFLILITLIAFGISCEKKADAKQNTQDTESHGCGDCNEPCGEEKTEVHEHKSACCEKNKAIVTFVELGSSSCIPCKKMEPVMNAIEEEYGDKVNVIFYDVKTSEGKPFAQKYKIKLIPTQVFLDADGNEFFRHEGFFPQEEIKKVLQQKGL